MTTVAVVILAFASCVSTVVFSYTNAVLLRGLPFAQSDRIMAVSSADERTPNIRVSVQEYESWRAATRTFASLSLVTGSPFNVSDEGRPAERYPGSFVSGNFFDMLGQPTLLGRVFTPDDDRAGAAAVAVIGYGVWQTRYASDSSLIGRTVRINDVPTTIVGVMPRGMRFPNTDVWLPVARSPGARQESRTVRMFQGVGRLADGVTIAQTRQEFASIGARMARDYPETNRNISTTITPFADFINGPEISLVSYALVGAAIFVLIIVCTNVANLLLARGLEREQEMRIRTSLGASRQRLAAQLLLESVVLSILSGLVSLPITLLAIKWLDVAMIDVGKPYWIEFTFDRRVLGAFLISCLATPVVSGLVPALGVLRRSSGNALRMSTQYGATRLGQRWTTALVVVQVVVTLALLAAAGFMTRSFLAFYRLDVGFDAARMMTMQMFLSDQKYGTPDSREHFMAQLDERLARSAFGVATIASHFPLGGGARQQLEISGRRWTSGVQPSVTMVSVGPRYFDTLNLSLPRGQPFTGYGSNESRAEAIVNQRFATLFFNGGDAIGQNIRLTEPQSRRSDTQWLTIVGVAPTIRQRDPQNVDPDPVVYVPFLGNATLTQPLLILMRAKGDLTAVTRAVREDVRTLDPGLPLYNVRMMETNLAQLRWPYRIFGFMFGALAVIALLLASGGLYAICAHSVSRSTREIGLRLALGALPRQVSTLFVRRACRRLAVGLALGVVAAVGVARALQTILVQTGPTDIATLITITTLAAGLGVASCWIPARSILRVDPVEALRCQ